MYGMDRRATDEKIAQLSDLFELAGFLDELGQTYSHGMKQRVVVSAALLHDPRVLVIDEPTVGLDPKGANTLKAVLQDLARNSVSIFLSTHTLDIAEEIADRVGIIREGAVIALGTLDEIYAAARTDRRLEQAFLRLTEEA
jgi:ABC-2 type transport system ATP-binding protein